MSLERLNNPSSSNSQKEKSKSLFGFMSKSSDSSSSVEINNTVILAYGYITAYAAPR